MNKNAKKLFINAAAVLVLSAGIISCGKDDDGPVITPPDPIGGFNNSDEVGGANLKAHWTFDGTNNEKGSSVGPLTTVRNSFATGIKGQALNLDSGYLLYPTIPNLNNGAPGSITVSAWIKTQNNPGGPTVVFGLTTGTSTQAQWNDSPLLMFLENGRESTYNDTLVFKSAFATYPAALPVRGDNINDYGVRETDFKTVLGANKWVHYVARYDGVNSNFDLFADGIIVSNNLFRHRETAPGVGVGDLIIPTPTQVIIGGFPNAVTGYGLSATEPWHSMFKGQIDEVRVYSTSLADADISALYQLEKAGR